MNSLILGCNSFTNPINPEPNTSICPLNQTISVPSPRGDAQWLVRRGPRGQGFSWVRRGSGPIGRLPSRKSFCTQKSRNPAGLLLPQQKSMTSHRASLLVRGRLWLDLRDVLGSGSGLLFMPKHQRERERERQRQRQKTLFDENKKRQVKLLHPGINEFTAYR